MLPPPAPPVDCAEAAAGAATIAHAISAQAPRAGRRMSRKLLRPLFGLGPTGLADGLAPEERRYHRVIGGFAPRMASFDALRTVPPFTGPTASGPATRERNWLVVDATGKTLGRLATQVADALRGKRKPDYTPHIDVGDFVVVVNAEKVSVTGNKREQKRYYRHSGYPGGLRSRTLDDMLERRPEEVVRLAVKGMLPRTRLGRAQLGKLKVYAGPDHPHAAQKPEPMEVNA